MPSLDDIARITNTLVPTRTTLFLGAGAGVTSGAPTTQELCRHLEATLAGGEHITDDLAELSSILVARRSRREVIAAVTDRLSTLKPDGALISLAAYPWAAIYTTNYDQLLEQAFAFAKQPYAVVRSNYDWEEAHRPGRVPIFKIHGCVGQDVSFGHKASMILTLEDYDAHADYRQLLYQRLETGFAGGAVVVIGYSLQDRDIQELFSRGARLQRHQGAPGKIHLVMYQIDGERADVWRSRGAANVAQGDINKFVHSLHQVTPQPVALPRVAGSTALLPELAACTVNVVDAPMTANVVRFFYGGPATFGDISAGFTFERDLERDLVAASSPIIVITGVSGTGKSTLARRVLARAPAELGVLAFEHRSEYPLNDSAWSDFEATLREADQRALLLVDNCTQFQREINRLCRRLPGDTYLRLVLTAETSAWRVRQKDPRLFSDAKSVALSMLSRNELTRLLQHVKAMPQLTGLVGLGFLSLKTHDQLHVLERRCQADMFVCLKALFSAESLDQIILAEYASLESPYQSVYRVTCALQAAGALPHRQMVLRVTGLDASLVASALTVLEGMIDESDSNPALGIYSWRSRHEVIAELISKYKYSDPTELFRLLEMVIDTANPSIYEEARTLREMCSAPRGIKALVDRQQRLVLFRSISSAMPGDRVARHRLVSELLRDERIADAEAELIRAIDEVGLDPPLQRYKVRLEILRSRAPGIMLEDRKAMLDIAFNEAELGLRRFPETKHLYLVLADAALEWEKLTGERGRTVWAAGILDGAYERLLDPELADRRRELLR